MKELSIEEKAKAYDESLEKAKQVYNDCICCRKCLNELFPVLAESEDEKIIKSLSTYFAKFKPDDMWDDDFSCGDIVAWLEKQSKASKVEESMREVEEKAKAFTETHKGKTSEEILAQMKGEQKSTDKIEPKFHEGDWVVSPNGVYWHIDKISNNRYEVTSNTGKGSGSWNLDTNIYHKFTIQDAKDGDVLVDVYENIGIFEKRYGINWHTYCYLGNEGRFIPEGGSHGSICYPATKEQRDFLFQKIKEAGYEWDTEKKELRKIEQKFPNKIEPKFKVGDKIQYLKGCGTIMTIEKIENGEYIFGNNLGHTTIEDGNKWYLVEHNPTWSEEDEIALADALWCCKQAASIAKDENEMGNCWYAENWLKSLRPQNTWKPSEGQLECLEYAIEKAEKDWSPLTNNRIYLTLKSLKEQLEKL